MPDSHVRMTDADRTPILIGAGQLTQRDVDPAAALEPLALMVETARRAAADAGANVDLLTRIDAVGVVNIISWQYKNAPRLLGEGVGAHPTEMIYTTVGGNTPQWLVNETAAKIAAGSVRLALLAGAEAVHSLRRARKAGVTLQWTRDSGAEATVVGDTRLGTNPHEMAHQMQMPTQIFPLFENALRAHRGIGIEAHRAELGRLCSSFTAIASENPYAWFRTPRTAAEITTVTPNNRMIGFPYPKYMNAIMDVDQAAAVLMTSVGTARALGIDPSRWVYLRGCGDATDLWFASQRVDYYSSPAIRRAGEEAMTMAGITQSEIDYLDLYSCFPCAVQLGRDMLGIPSDDPRPLSLTGALPYHGGPGSNYTMHAIATLMAKLRQSPEKLGLVSGLGWYATKHSVGLYGTTPNETAWRRVDPYTYQAELDRMPHPELVERPSGTGTIETYTVLHDREGQPSTGIVVGRLDDGRRFLANTSNDTAMLESLMSREGVGRRGRVSPTNGTNRFEIS